MSKLTPKQEKFSRKYVELGNAATAYRETYNAEKMQQNTVYTEANKLLKNPKIATRVDELMESGNDKHEVKRHKIIDRLMQIAETAQKKNKLGDAIRALELVGKDIGMFKQQVEADINVNNQDEFVKSMLIANGIADDEHAGSSKLQ